MQLPLNSTAEGEEYTLNYITSQAMCYENDWMIMCLNASSQHFLSIVVGQIRHILLLIPWLPTSQRLAPLIFSAKMAYHQDHFPRWMHYNPRYRPSCWVDRLVTDLPAS